MKNDKNSLKKRLYVIFCVILSSSVWAISEYVHSCMPAVRGRTVLDNLIIIALLCVFGVYTANKL